MRLSQTKGVCFLKTIFTASCCALFFASAVRAQNPDEPRWHQLLDQLAFHANGGIDETYSTTSKNLSTGYDIQAGLGYNFTKHLTLLCDLGWDRFRITLPALNALGTPQGYPGGHLHTDSVTADPLWHFHPKGAWDYYVTGGGGAFERTQNLTRPTVATATGTDAFFGFNTPGYPSSEMPLVYSVKKPGLDGAVGVSVNVKYGLKLYAEVRYNHVFAGSLKNMDWMPITLGVRW